MTEDEINQEIEAEATKATEPVAEEAPAVVEEAPTVVPKEQYDAIHRAMDAERFKRKELQQKWEEERMARVEREARLEERLNVLNKMWGVEDKKDPEHEREVAFKQQQEELGRTRQEVEALKVVTQLNVQETQFASKTPDYEVAKNWFFQKRNETLQALGYDEAESQNQIGVEINAMIGRALKGNQNAAQLLYEASKKMGYIPEAQKGQAKLEVIKTGQATNQQLPKGAPPKGELSIDRLASMSDEEFKNLTEADFRRVMGG